MADKKITLFVFSLLFLGIVSMSCGCIQTGSESKEIGTVAGGASIVEHEYLFGLMESKYDVRVWVLGTDVVNMQGIKKSEYDVVLKKHNISIE
jgi:hypothetical protein